MRLRITISDDICPGAQSVQLKTPGGPIAFSRRGKSPQLTREIEVADDVGVSLAAFLASEGYVVEQLKRPKGKPKSEAAPTTSGEKEAAEAAPTEGN